MALLSVIVPCYNEQETVSTFLTEIKKVESEMARYTHFEYIFLNDVSTYRTLELLKKAAKQFDNVHYLSFSRHFGKDAALLAGL